MTENKENPYNKVKILEVCGPLTQYGGMALIGTLQQFDAGYYAFTYTRSYDFKTKPLPGLKDYRNTTTSIQTWPFFSVRIPPLKRADVMKKAHEMGLDVSHTMALLAVFGASVIVNPYILVSKFTEDSHG